MWSEKSLNVLVTGGSGFVGRALLRELLAHGHRVLATTRHPERCLPGDGPLRWVVWDALRRPLPDIEWSGIDAVVHLAAPTENIAGPGSAAAHYQLSVAATFHLLEQAVRHGIGRFLLASTGDVLGGTDGPAREDDVCYRPDSFYGAAKACGELLTRSFRPLLKTTILRFYHPYGPHGDRFLINRLLRRVAAGEVLTVEGEDGILLNPVWVDDLAEGVRLALEVGAPGLFHLAGPEMVTLRQLGRLMGDLVGRPPVFVTVARPAVQRHAGDDSAARRVLGYHPRVGLREGLLRLLGTEAQRPGVAIAEGCHA